MPGNGIRRIAGSTTSSRWRSSQNLDAAPHGVPPPRFPVFSKPIVNLKGMGVGSRVLQSQADYVEHYAPGHFWMTLLDGRHVSSDIAVVDGEPRWWRHVTGKPAGEGTFDYWIVHAEPDADIETHCGAWVRKNLAGYTGMLNLETIGGTIIEAHLRFADQWPDLYGPGWVDALVGLYESGEWDFYDDDRSEGYSVVLFGPNGRRYRHPPPALVDDDQAHAGRHQRANHLPRRPRAGTARHAARRLSPRHRQRLRSARGAGGRASGCREFFLPRPSP